MLEIEDITELPFDSKGETKLIVIDKYDYSKFIENTAKLKAIENLAREDEVVSGDVILAICGVSRKMVYGFKNKENEEEK